MTPTGVEHPPKKQAPPLVDATQTAMTPTGVEHVKGFRFTNRQAQTETQTAMTPTGVEHQCQRTGLAALARRRQQ